MTSILLIISTLVFSEAKTLLTKIPVPLEAPAVTQAPEQIRLTFTLDATASTTGIYWTTSNKTTDDYVATVQYGLTESSMTQGVTGSNDNYTAFNIKSPSIHFATMTGLKPSTFYWYKVGSPVYGWSINLNFTTRPVDGDASRYPITWIAYGDMGISNSQATADLTAKKIQSGEASFITHAGDISYADNRAGINNGSIYEGVLNDFYNEVQPSSAYGAYMTSSGYVYTLCPSRSYITLKRGYIILKRSYGFS
jgi:phosphodiesterase/alkaline phosphatase D-like protein